MLFSIPGGFINLFILWIVLQLYFLRPSIKEFFGQCKAKTRDNNKTFKKILEEKYEVNGMQVFYFFTKLGLGSWSCLISWDCHTLSILHNGSHLVLQVKWRKIDLFKMHKSIHRKPGFMPGWTTLFNWEGDITIATATPTLLIVVLFFIIPADLNDPKWGWNIS